MFPGQLFLTTSGAFVIAQRIGPSQTRLLSATVPAAKVRKLWPAAKQSIAAEAHCQKHLIAEMKRSPDRAPKPSPDLYEDCRTRFPGLSERGYERARAKAIKLTGAGWGKGGRPKSSH
jgi:hypothetical protein